MATQLSTITIQVTTIHHLLLWCCCFAIVHAAAVETCVNPQNNKALFSSPVAIPVLSINGPRIVVADLDNDGSLDVASAGINQKQIVWLKNADGLGTFSKPETVATCPHGPQSLVAGDFNGDGFLDLAASLTDTWNQGAAFIAWYNNTEEKGNRSFHTITVERGGRGGSALAVGDINNDSFLDLVIGLVDSMSADQNKILWYMNTDGKGTFVKQNVISSNFNGNSIALGVFDINGDGFMDVVTTIPALEWHNNTDGKGTFDQTIVLPTQYGINGQFAVADLNGDGHLDIASVGGSLAWYVNIDGSGIFSNPIIVNGTLSNSFATVLAVGDIDKDGFVDLVTASKISSHVNWYRNTDGKGTFSMPIDVYSGWSVFPDNIAVGDVNGDGWLDIILANQWFENTGPHGCCPPGQGAKAGDYCASCTSGRYAPSSSAKPCLLCPAGFFSRAFGQTSIDTCSPCAAGQYADESALSACKQCAAGRFSSEVGLAKRCKGLCSAGRYSSETGTTFNNTCTGECNPGEYSEEIGQSSKTIKCIACALHTYTSERGSAKCKYCPTGYDNTITHSESCASNGADPGCSQGKYSTQQGSVRFHVLYASCCCCVVCELKVQVFTSFVFPSCSQVNASLCVPCPAGYYSARRGTVRRCKGSCRSGKYSSELGRISDDQCQDCIPGTYGTKSAARSSNACIQCSPGTYSATPAARNVTSCISCPRGKFSDNVGASLASVCTLCGRRPRTSS